MKLYAAQITIAHISLFRLVQPPLIIAMLQSSKKKATSHAFMAQRIAFNNACLRKHAF
jgi:hypothetical protein